MNDITVLDVLALPIMGNARLKAGHGGLSRPIQYVNILDNRFDDTTTSDQLPKYGDNFYITSMYHGKDDPEYIINVLLHFIEVEAAAVCIIDEYVDQLPEQAYALCNGADLPLLFIDKDTPYPIIISSIMELKLSYQKAHQTEALLFTLSAQYNSEDQVEAILKQLNTNFLSNVLAFHILHAETDCPDNSKANQLQLIGQFNEQSNSFASEYKGGILVIQSFADIAPSKIEELIKKTVSMIHHLLRGTVIGVSQTHYLMEIGVAITEATTAVKSGACCIEDMICFHELGPIRLLMDLQGKPALNNYFYEIYQPLADYDKSHNSNLLDTIYSFIENKMDYIRTSKSMFVHENTVRYRLSKVKSLIPYGISDLDFEQTLYLFYKIAKLNETI